MALGIANALGWLSLVRIALLFTGLTLGFGALLSALVLFGVAALLSQMHVYTVGAAFVVLGMTLLTTMIRSILAVDPGGDLW